MESHLSARGRLLARQQQWLADRLSRGRGPSSRRDFREVEMETLRSRAARQKFEAPACVRSARVNADCAAHSPHSGGLRSELPVSIKTSSGRGLRPAKVVQLGTRKRTARNKPKTANRPNERERVALRCELRPADAPTSRMARSSPPPLAGARCRTSLRRRRRRERSVALRPNSQ